MHECCSYLLCPWTSSCQLSLAIWQLCQYKQEQQLHVSAWPATVLACLPVDHACIASSQQNQIERGIFITWLLQE
jgi:hypothetical protein